jgi:hypothetical protein
MFECTNVRAYEPANSNRNAACSQHDYNLKIKLNVAIGVTRSSISTSEDMILRCVERAVKMRWKTRWATF